MKNRIAPLFILLSRGILNGPAVRMRTYQVFTQVFLIVALTGLFVFCRLLHASSLIVGSAMFLLAGASWLIIRFTRQYVNNNWRLFSPRAKANVQHLWAWRSLAYCIYLGLILSMAVSGYWWGKDNAQAKREARHVQ